MKIHVKKRGRCQLIMSILVVFRFDALMNYGFVHQINCVCSFISFYFIRLCVHHIIICQAYF